MFFCCAGGSRQFKTNEDLVFAATGFSGEVTINDYPQRYRHRYRPRSARSGSSGSRASEESSSTATSARSRRSEKSQRQEADRPVEHVDHVPEGSAPLRRPETAASSEADYPQAPSLTSAPSQTKTLDLTTKISELSRPLSSDRHISSYGRQVNPVATHLRDHPPAASGLSVSGGYGANGTGMLISELQDSERSGWNEENRSVTTVSVQPRWIDGNNSVIAESVKPTWLLDTSSFRGEEGRPSKWVDKDESIALGRRYPGEMSDAVSPTAGSVRPGWVDGAGSFIAGQTRASLSDYMESPKTESVQYGRQSDDGSIGFEPRRSGWKTVGSTRPICIGDNDYSLGWIGKNSLGPNLPWYDEKRGFLGLRAGKYESGESFKTRKPIARTGTMDLIPELDPDQAAEHTSEQEHTTEGQDNGSGNGVGHEAANFASSPVTTMGGQSSSEDAARPLSELAGPLQEETKPSSELDKSSSSTRAYIDCLAVVEKVNYIPPTFDNQPNETNGKEGVKTSIKNSSRSEKNKKPDRRGSSSSPVKRIPKGIDKDLKKQSPRQGTAEAPIVSKIIRSKTLPPADRINGGSKLATPAVGPKRSRSKDRPPLPTYSPPSHSEVVSATPPSPSAVRLINPGFTIYYTAPGLSISNLTLANKSSSKGGASPANKTPESSSTLSKSRSSDAGGSLYPPLVSVTTVLPAAPVSGSKGTRSLLRPTAKKAPYGAEGSTQAKSRTKASKGQNRSMDARKKANTGTKPVKVFSTPSQTPSATRTGRSENDRDEARRRTRTKNEVAEKSKKLAKSKTHNRNGEARRRCQTPKVRSTSSTRQDNCNDGTSTTPRLSGSSLGEGQATELAAVEVVPKNPAASTKPSQSSHFVPANVKEAFARLSPNKAGNHKVRERKTAKKGNEGAPLPSANKSGTLYGTGASENKIPGAKSAFAATGAGGAASPTLQQGEAVDPLLLRQTRGGKDAQKGTGVGATGASDDGTGDGIGEDQGKAMLSMTKQTINYGRRSQNVPGLGTPRERKNLGHISGRALGRLRPVHEDKTLPSKSRSAKPLHQSDGVDGVFIAMRPDKNSNKQIELAKSARDVADIPAFGPYGHHTEDSSSPKIAAKDASPSISSNSNGANSSTASNIVVKEEIEVVASTPRDNSALKPVAISSGSGKAGKEGAITALNKEELGAEWLKERLKYAPDTLKRDDSTRSWSKSNLQRGISRTSSLDDGSMRSFSAQRAMFSPNRFNPCACALSWFGSVDGSRCDDSVRSIMTNEPRDFSSTSFPSGRGVSDQKIVVLRPQLNKSERQAVAKLKIDRGEVHIGQRPVADSTKVYKAEINNKKHAAKVCDITCVSKESQADLLNTFDAELLALSRLNTPNIAKVYGASVSPSEIIVVSEFVEGGTLRDMLNNNRHKHRHKYLTVRMRLTIAQDIAAGMKELYAYGMQHRKLSSKNILLTDDWRAKIFGIGLAMTKEILSFVDGSDENFDEEDDSESLIWASREVFSAGSFSQKSDVYSFGIVLWEIMQPDGSMPYAGLSLAEVSAQKYNGQGLPTPRNCPPVIAGLMESCLSKLPDKRPTFDTICRILAEPGIVPFLGDA